MLEKVDRKPEGQPVMECKEAQVLGFQLVKVGQAVKGLVVRLGMDGITQWAMIWGDHWVGIVGW